MSDDFPTKPKANKKAKQQTPKAVETPAKAPDVVVEATSRITKGHSQNRRTDGNQGVSSRTFGG